MTRAAVDERASMLIVESVLIAALVIAAIYFVTVMDRPEVGHGITRDVVRTSGEDALDVFASIAACSGLEGDELAACENAYGGSALKRALTESLTGEPGNLTFRVRALLPVGIEWNLHLDNGADTMPVRRFVELDGERVSAARMLTPEWNLTAVVPHLSRFNWSATGDNAMIVEALPMWKSRAVLHDDDAGFKVRFSNGDQVAVANLRVDGERGTLSTLAHWRMNEGSGSVAADAVGDLDLVGFSSSRWVDGRVGHALQFTVPADALVVTAPKSVDLSEASVLAWLRPDALPTAGHGRVATVESGAGPVLDVLLEDDTGVLVARVREGATITATARGETVLAAGSWTHAAAVLDDTELVLYVNGEREASATLDAAFPEGAPTLRVGGKLESTDPDAAVFEGRVDEVRVYRRALGADEFSRARWAVVATDRGAAPGWDARTASPRSVASDAAWKGQPLTGSALYRVGTDAVLATAAAPLARGLNDSVLAAYDNSTWARAVTVGGEVAVEFDFRPALRELEDAGVRFAAASKNYTTVAVRAPVTQPPGSNMRHHETFNVTYEGVHGYANFTLPRNAVLGTHVVVASLNVTLDGAAPEGVLLRKTDYFHATLPGMTEPPLNPVYRVVLELRVPEWR